MNKEIAFKWADELDSGRHIQGFGALEWSLLNGRVTNCCLGVAGRMFFPREDGEERVGSKCPIDGLYGVLSEELMEIMGMKTSDGELPFLDRNDELLSLTMLNDSQEFSFSQIADIIRCFYKEL